MTDHRKAPTSRIGRRLLDAATARVEGKGDDLVTRASTRFLQRATAVMDRLDGVAATLEKVAAVELKVAERLLPIVDDLGELVRHALDEVRERRGLLPRDSSVGQPIVVDVSPSSDTERIDG